MLKIGKSISSHDLFFLWGMCSGFGMIIISLGRYGKSGCGFDLMHLWWPCHHVSCRKRATLGNVCLLHHAEIMWERLPAICMLAQVRKYAGFSFARVVCSWWYHKTSTVIHPPCPPKSSNITLIVRHRSYCNIKPSSTTLEPVARSSFQECWARIRPEMACVEHRKVWKRLLGWHAIMEESDH